MTCLSARARRGGNPRRSPIRRALVALVSLLTVDAARAESVARFPEVDVSRVAGPPALAPRAAGDRAPLPPPGPTGQPPPPPTARAPTRAAPERVEPPPSTRGRAVVPSGAGELESRARRFETEGRLTEALAAYSESIRLDARDGSALLALGRLRARLGDANEAELLFSTATRYRDVAADALAERARLRRSAGRDAEALADLEAAEALGSAEPARAEELAAWYVSRRAWLPALSVWRRASADLEAPESVHRAKIRTRALVVLAGELDPVSAGQARGYSFTRRLLARLSKR